MNNYFITRNVCPVCKSSNLLELERLFYTEPPISNYLINNYPPPNKIDFAYLEKAEFVLLECLDCNFIFQSQIPNEILMEKLYSEWLNPNSTKKNTYQHYNSIEVVIDHIKEIINIIKYFNQKDPIKIYDYGLGWGIWAQRALALGCDVYATELSRERINHAKQKGIKIINFSEMSHYQFDFINSFAVFEHIHYPFETLMKLVDMLKPGGIIRIYVPNCWDLKTRLKNKDWNAKKGSKNSLNAISPLEHINSFNHNSLIKLGSIAGLRRIQIHPQIFCSIRDFLRNVLHPYQQLFTSRKDTNIYFIKSF